MMKKLTINIFLVSAFIFTAAIFLIHTPTANALNTTYYVNNKAGSNCANTHAGTAQGSPWCDFTNVNSRTFGGGDQVLLARGATWNQQMTINGSGTSANYAIIGAYGTGNKPAILRNKNEADRGIRMNNPSYWQVSDLEVGNAGTGILVHYDTKFHDGLRFSNLYLHHNSGITRGDTASGAADHIYFSSGIVFTGNIGALGSSEYVLRDVILDTIEGTKNINSISFNWNNSGSVTSNQHLTTQDVVIKNIYLHDDDGDGRSSSCSQSLDLINMTRVVLKNANLDNVAACYAPQGTAAILLGRVDHVEIVNSMIHNTPVTGSGDETGIDFEMDTDNVTIHNNYFGNNAGAGFELLNIAPGYTVSNTYSSGNTFVNNGHGANPGGGMATAGNSSTFPTGTASNNIYAEPNGFNTTWYNGSWQNYTFTNNKNAIDTEIYSALKGFSATQGSNRWSYQYKVSGVWNNSTYDSTNKRWSDGNLNIVSQFWQHPENCSGCDSARVWTAPMNGTVSIRGWVSKSNAGGNGVLVRITKNGTRIWPVAGDQTIAGNDELGVNTELDNITVVTGDLIRFEVGNNGNYSYDATSWAPTVAYPSLGFMMINDNAISSSSYVGPGWIYDPNRSGLGDYAGDEHYTQTNNEYFEYTFTGTRVDYIAEKASGGGNIDLYIDGVFQQTVNTYNATRLVQQVIYSKTGLSNASHTIKGIKKSGSYMEVDAFKVYS
ncbi:hypothetical protein EHS13_30900 [Paenibacillus psychroresistens]|uniref:Right handed beta helix domain-containing protein n=1 Tax=Paenibacillus psychroresistens TaxID=1778678 RepID=A0A6B8RTS8_9BACL|nr:hypothetical protein [Paenibacillus psychroresistens]QGQ98975.1 hypothetical protein EHS13_30900 [Paenibacillus psychroresistens]